MAVKVAGFSAKFAGLPTLSAPVFESLFSGGGLIVFDHL
jgi:hypothetical protein